MQRDPRAVQDPISAVFELAEDVDAQTPKIRRVLRYVRVFVWLWLLIDVFVILSVSVMPVFSLVLTTVLVALFLSMRRVRERRGRTVISVGAAAVSAVVALTFGESLLVGIVAVVLLYLGFVILGLMRDLRGFFDYFALRHRVVQRVREADPTVYVPQGADAVRRALAHLAATDPDVAHPMRLPGGVTSPALLTGKSGLAYAFDAYVVSRPSRWWTWFGIGYTGLAAFVKAFDHPPTSADLEAVRRAVEDVGAATHVPPARVVAVWQWAPGVHVSQEAYEFLLRESVRVRHRGSTFAASLELFTENEDGTYDRIPVVVTSPVSSGARTVPA